MAWKTGGLSILKLLLSLWLTITLVFFLSRLLPAVNTPKGLVDAEVALYGGVNAETVANVTSDYRNRKGLSLPPFYISINDSYNLEDLNVSSVELDSAWLQQCLRWKNPLATRSFYLSYLSWQSAHTKPIVKALQDKLLTWAKSEDLNERSTAEASFITFLKSLSDPESKSLLSDWKILSKSSIPFSSMLPALEWHGAQNAYHQWLLKFLKGDLGTSFQDYQPVIVKIKDSALISSSLALLGLLLGLLFAYVAGTYLALKPFSVFSQIMQFFLYLLDSVPAFIIALLLFAFSLVWMANFPSGIMTDHLQDLPLFYLWGQPAILVGSFCVTLLILPHLTLQFSRSLQDQTHRLYFRTALAKGLTHKKALARHGIPNALAPTLTLLSEMIIGLMSGVLVIEITFSLPGIGSLLANAILTGDYPVMIGLSLFFLLFRALVVWLTDIMLRYLDPRLSNDVI